MPLPLAAVLGASAGLKFLGGLFGKKGKKKQVQEQDAAARRGHDQDEKARISRLKSLQGFAGNRGLSELSFDPEMFQARPYTGADRTKGSTWSLLGDAAGGLGDIGLSYAAQQQAADAGTEGAPGRNNFPTPGTSPTADSYLCGLGFEEFCN